MRNLFFCDKFIVCLQIQHHHGGGGEGHEHVRRQLLPSGSHLYLALSARPQHRQLQIPSRNPGKILVREMFLKTG